MERSLVSVLVHAIVVVKSVGQIAAFLNLRYQGPGTDGMNGTGFYIEEIVLEDLHVVKVLFYLSGFDASSDLSLRNVVAEAVNKLCSGLCVENIPHFGLA